MNLLLDTHIVIWAILDDPRLSARARSLLTDPANTVWASAVSYVEVAIKNSLGRAGLGCTGADLAGWLRRSGTKELGMLPAHAATLESLPWHHRDPFDRMLVAQALAEPMRLVTHDERMAQYSTTVIVV
jgi:PIN domain nuclease of toxin-antitoxin system